MFLPSSSWSSPSSKQDQLCLLDPLYRFYAFFPSDFTDSRLHMDSGYVKYDSLHVLVTLSTLNDYIQQQCKGLLKLFYTLDWQFVLLYTTLLFDTFLQAIGKRAFWRFKDLCFILLKPSQHLDIKRSRNITVTVKTNFIPRPSCRIKRMKCILTAF